MLIGEAKCLEGIITSFVDNGKATRECSRIDDLDLRPVRVRDVNCSHILWHFWRNRRLFYRYRPSYGTSTVPLADKKRAVSIARELTSAFQLRERFVPSS